MHHFSTLKLIIIQSALFVSCITNNADLIWYGKGSDEPHNYYAREPVPKGLVNSHRIVVNQQLPILWEVKFAFFDNLDVLIIDQCGVNELRPHTFQDLKPLANLSLTRNNIAEIRDGVFNGVQIEHLDLSRNKIAVIAPHALDNITTLVSVSLDRNELRKWNSEWFLNCPSLETVTAMYNFIQELPREAFQNFAATNAPISVYLGHNKIRTIASDTLIGVDFDQLGLDWNNLSEFDHVELNSAKRLNLNGNSVECLTVANFLNKTDVLSIESNPLRVECLEKMLRYVKSESIEIKVTDNRKASVLSKI